MKLSALYSTLSLVAATIAVVHGGDAIVVEDPVVAKNTPHQQDPSSTVADETTEPRGTTARRSSHYEKKMPPQQKIKQQEPPPSPFRLWLLEDYPNPEDLEVRTTTDKETEEETTSSSTLMTTRCGGFPRLCDPDVILRSEEEAKELSEFLSLTRRAAVTLCPEEETEASIEIQYAIAMAKKMDLTPYGLYDDRADRAAKAFAQGIHDDWGVGMETKCGGTGVLIFISIVDRAIFISRGKGLERILNDYRLDRVIESMKPFLRQALFKDALMEAIRELDSLIEKGNPEWGEYMQDMLKEYVALLSIFGMIGFAAYSMRKEQRERREYAQVASQLSEIDRARAQALQGQYKAESCPICLEPFSTEGTVPTEGDGERTNPTIGSDGAPIKLLRCGHVFDQTCFEQWVSSGQGNVTQCPICKMDVGQGPPQEPDDTLNQDGNTNTDNQQGIPEGDEPDQQQARAAQRRGSLRRYNYERQFRLSRLGRRYPQYIGQQQIQRWTQSTYDGQLARDPSFVRNNPTLRTSRSNSDDGGSRFRSRGSSGFGGGSSGGGRSGRW